MRSGGRSATAPVTDRFAFEAVHARTERGDETLTERLPISESRVAVDALAGAPRHRPGSAGLQVPIWTRLAPATMASTPARIRPDLGTCRSMP